MTTAILNVLKSAADIISSVFIFVSFRVYRITFKSLISDLTSQAAS